MKKTKRPAKYVPVLTLGSVAASEVRWYFQSAHAELGVKSASMEGDTGGHVPPHPETIGLKSRRQIQIAGKYRRIHAGMMHLLSHQYETLRLCFEPRRRAGELESWFGTLVNVAYAKALEHPAWGIARFDDPWVALESWLIEVVKSPKHTCAVQTPKGAAIKPLRLVLREDAEQAVARALDAYAAVRVEPSPDEPGEYRERGTRGPRRSVARDFA